MSAQADGMRRLPRMEKGRDPYDGLRFYSFLTHLIAAALSAGSSVLLTVRAALTGTATHVASFLVYGIAQTLLYAASALYHSLRTGPLGRIALRKLDHCMIYVLIAGTYTPICLVALRGVWGTVLFAVVWGLAAAGIAMKTVWMAAPRWLSVATYLGMGWVALIAIWPLSRVLSAAGFVLLFLGGALFTVGGVLYAVKWPGRDRPKFGCHEVFHLFCIAGSACHFLMMYFAILPIRL